MEMISLLFIFYCLSPVFYAIYLYANDRSSGSDISSFILWYVSGLVVFFLMMTFLLGFGMASDASDPLTTFVSLVFILAPVMAIRYLMTESKKRGSS